MNRRQILKNSLVYITGAAQAGSWRLCKSHAETNNIGEADNIRSQLTRNLDDVVDAWFPRTVDTEQGGFICDFDENWRPAGSQLKRLEFQARQVRAAAQAAIFDGSYRQAHSAAEHGFNYLTEIMWDHKYGGWFYMLHRNGEPVYTEKHLHGVAYAIQACVAHHDLTGRMEGLQVAKAAFDWFDAHAHDAVNGGYFSYLNQVGKPIVTPLPGGGPLDPIGTRIGLKDCNTILDLAEAFADLFRATGDSHVGRRLNELLLIVRDSMLQPSGIMNRSYTPEWQPADNLTEIGVMLQGSCTLAKASEVLSFSAPSEIADIARGIVDTCLRNVWDRNEGGFSYEGIVSGGALAVHQHKKEWWVQAEGLRALLKQAIRSSEDADDYVDQCLRLWTYIDLNLVDHARKGWYQTASSSGYAKAHMWKDASHEVRALIECIEMLTEANDPKGL